MAQAFIISEEFIGQNKVVLELGDYIFYGLGMSKTLQRNSKPDGRVTLASFSQRINRLAGSSVIPAEIFAVTSSVQLEKIPFPHPVMLPGSVILVRLLQPLNAERPIVSNVAGRVMLLSEEQLENAQPSIDLRPAGKLTVSRSLQPEKVNVPRVKTPDGRVSALKLEQYPKADLPMLVTFAGKVSDVILLQK